MKPIASLTMICALALAACASPPDATQSIDPIGDFRLGHNIVVTQDITQGPFSRDATEEEIKTAVEARLEERLRRFDGDGLYHLGVRVAAYALAAAGIPVVFSPRSVMLLAVNIWDNRTQEKLTEEPVRITAFEGINTGVPLIPSGLIKSRDTQLENLSISAAQRIEEWLRENEDLWFQEKPGQVRVTFPPVNDAGDVESPEDIEIPSGA